MRITPSRHELEFGEGLSWSPPALASRFFIWDKTEAFSGSAAPRWLQVAGFDIENGAPIIVQGQSTALTVSADGVAATWETIAAAGDGYDPEFLLITAQDAHGRPVSIDRYSVPVPESSAAATVAAQERAYLQSLLTTRSNVAASGGFAKQEDPSGTNTELMDLSTLDRRVAEDQGADRVVRTGGRGQCDGEDGDVVSAAAPAPKARAHRRRLRGRGCGRRCRRSAKSPARTSKHWNGGWRRSSAR